MSQPQPGPGRQGVSPVARRRFLEVFDAQDAVGLETYASPLRTQNGRDFAQDAWEELVDLAKYLTGLEMERLADADVISRLHALLSASEGHVTPPGHPDHRCLGCPQREDGWT